MQDNVNYMENSDENISIMSTKTREAVQGTRVSLVFLGIMKHCPKILKENQASASDPQSFQYGSTETLGMKVCKLFIAYNL